MLIACSTPALLNEKAMLIARAGLGGLVIIVLAIGPNVCRFKPGRGLCIFKFVARLHSEGSKAVGLLS
jgi:hypothetical protein